MSETNRHVIIWAYVATTSKSLLNSAGKTANPAEFRSTIENQGEFQFDTLSCTGSLEAEDRNAPFAQHVVNEPLAHLE